jgi:hypothetical protein
MLLKKVRLAVVKPQFFPDDLTKLKEITKDNKYYLHISGDQIHFAVYLSKNKKPDKLGRLKVAYPVCFIDGKFETINGWKNVYGYKYPIWRIDEEQPPQSVPVIIVKGYQVAERLQKLLPNYFVTTFYGDSINWAKTDWESLRDRSVTFIPEVHSSTNKHVLQFENLAAFVAKEHDAYTKVVSVPSYEEVVATLQVEGINYNKHNWDFNDPHWKDLDIQRDFLDHAYEVTREYDDQEDYGYSSIQDDRLADRYVYQIEGDVYFDTFKNNWMKPQRIDKMYERDETLLMQKPKLTATQYLDRSNCKYVDMTTFSPGDPFLFSKDGYRFLNKYIPPTINLAEEDWDFDISIFRNHIKDVLCDGDQYTAQVIEDTIAWDLRNVGGNRKWMILFTSEEGLGKDLFFIALKKLYGESNCEDLQLEDLTERFRPWFLEACYLFIGEVDDSVVKNKKLKGWIKKIITDQTFRVEALKGIDSVRVKTAFTLWGSSNEAIPIRTNKNQRRFFLVDSAKIPKDIRAANPKYFDELGSFIENKGSMEAVLYYYKKVHKISDKYSEHVCPISESLEEIIEASQAEFIRYIDRIYREKPGEIASFKFDLVNVRRLTEELQTYSFDDDAWGGKNLKLDYNKVLRWVKRSPNKPVKKQAHTLPGKEKTEGRLWVIKNHKDWEQLTRIGGSHLDSMIDAHFYDGMTFGFKEKLEEKKEKEAS